NCLVWHLWKPEDSRLLPMCCPGGVMKLTEKKTDGLALPAGRKDFVWWDDDVAGFGIRVRDGGSRNWIYRYRIGSKQRSLILGSTKSVPLNVARKNASTLEARVRLGEDPALDRQNARLEADNTFGLLANQYLETQICQTPSSGANYSHITAKRR